MWFFVTSKFLFLQSLILTKLFFMDFGPNSAFKLSKLPILYAYRPNDPRICSVFLISQLMHTNLRNACLRLVIVSGHHKFLSNYSCKYNKKTNMILLCNSCILYIRVHEKLVRSIVYCRFLADF